MAVDLILIVKSNIIIIMMNTDKKIREEKPYTQMRLINPLVTNGLFRPYHLTESIFIFRDIRSNFSFLIHFSIKFM